MCLNHHQSAPPRPVEKLSSTKLVPIAEEIGDHCFKVLVTGVQYSDLQFLKATLHLQLL